MQNDVSSFQVIDIIADIHNARVHLYLCAPRVDLHFYLGDVFGTPPGIFRAENILHTQKLRNVSSIMHACIHAYIRVCALLENPFVKRPDGNLHWDFALTWTAAAGMPHYAFQALLSIFPPRPIFSSFSIFLHSSKRRFTWTYLVNIVFIAVTGCVKRVGRSCALILQ